jgi:hypothetical protein
MVLASLRESAFTEDDAELLTHIGTQVAIAVDNALNYERLRCAECEVVRERDRTKLLLEINNAVVSHLDLRELVKSISASLRRIIPHDAAFFTLLDSEGTRLQVQALDLQVLDQVPFVEGVSISLDGTPEGPSVVASWVGPTKLASAIMFATITNIAAYIPFLILTGTMGEFLYSLPIVMTCSLVASRLASMTFVPLLGYYLLRPDKKSEKPIEERRTTGFTGWYARTAKSAIAPSGWTTGRRLSLFAEHGRRA